MERTEQLLSAGFEKAMTRFLYLLVITAIALANISPACAFISGKADLIEICTADGIRFIDASSEQTTTDKSSQHKKLGESCAFCFAQGHEKSVAATSFNAFSVIKALKGSISLRKTFELSYKSSFYTARAPPPIA